ncbi:MAG: hypothetical protein HFI09_05100 [Bacilli bacterium]|nr:hypothetical protein [Bacilli bacterium]
MDTTELGAGKNPVPKEPEKINVYRFKCLCEVDIDVWAPDLLSAKAFCTVTDCDDFDLKKVEEIIDYEIVEEE